MKEQIYVIKSVVLDGSGVDEAIYATFDKEKADEKAKELNLEEICEKKMDEFYAVQAEEILENLTDYELDVMYFVVEVEMI